MPPDAPAAPATTTAPSATQPAPSAPSAPAPAPGSGPAAPPTVSFTPPPWAADWAPEDLGVVEAKSWQTPADVFRAYQAAQKFIGAPADELVRLPKNGEATAEQLQEIRARMGAPAKAEEYDFTEVRKAAGEQPLELLEPASKWFAELGLTQDQAQGVASRWQAYQSQQAAGQEEAWGVQVEQALNVLHQKYGPTFEAKEQLASSFVKRLGIAPDVVGLLERALGPERFFDTFAELGEKTAEHKVVEGDGAQRSYTPSGAAARAAELMSDPAYLDAGKPGHAQLKERVLALMKIAHGDQPIAGME